MVWVQELERQLEEMEADRVRLLKNMRDQAAQVSAYHTATLTGPLTAPVVEPGSLPSPLTASVVVDLSGRCPRRASALWASAPSR